MRTFCLLALILILSSCKSNQIYEGTFYDKENDLIHDFKADSICITSYRVGLMYNQYYGIFHLTNKKNLKIDYSIHTSITNSYLLNEIKNDSLKCIRIHIVNHFHESIPFAKIIAYVENERYAVLFTNENGILEISKKFISLRVSSIEYNDFNINYDDLSGNDITIMLGFNNPVEFNDSILMVKKRKLKFIKN